MTYEHPTTDATFDNPEEYAQTLINDIKRIKREQYQLAVEEGRVLTAIDKLAGRTDITSGTVTVQGMTEEAKVGRRQNVKYDKPRGGTHPLRILLENFPELMANAVDVTYKEKGKVIADLIDRANSGSSIDEREVELVQEILKTRVVSQGKPSLTIADRKDVQPEEGKAPDYAAN